MNQATFQECNLRIMMRRKLDEKKRFKVKFYLESKQDGSRFKGSITFKNKPRLSNVVHFIYRELNLQNEVNALPTAC